MSGTGYRALFYTIASVLIAFIVVGYSSLFVFFSSVEATSAYSVSSSSDFQRGFYENTESISKEGELKLKSTGTWNARVWRTPHLPLTDGTAIASDGTYTYLLVNRDTKFIRYIPGEDRWQTLATSPYMPYSGADMVTVGNDIYVTYGGYQKFFARYSITNNTWTKLTSLPDLIATGSSIQTDGTHLYILRGLSTTDFWKYTVATDSWSTLSAPPATIAGGANLIFDDTTGTDYLFTPRGAGTTTFYRYDIGANSWTTMAVAPSTLSENGNITKSGDFIYVLRGINTTTLYRYTISTDTWTTLAATPGTTRYAGLIYNEEEDLFYIFRGNNTYDWWKYNATTDSFLGPTDLPIAPGTGADIIYDSGYLFYRRGSSTNTFYRYDILADTWIVRSTAPSIFADDTKGIKAGSYLYYTRGSNTTEFHRYSPAGDSWSTMTVLPATAGAGSALAYPGSGSYIYATRGNNTTVFWRYNIDTNAWDDASVADLPTDNEVGVGARLVSDGTDIYAITGLGISNILKYTVATNTWSVLGTVPFAPYYGTDIVYYNGKIYAQAGYYKKELWEYTISSNTWLRLGDMSGYYSQNIGPYNGGSLAADTANGIVYSINGGGLLRMLSYTVGSANYPTSGTWRTDTIDLTSVSSWNSLSTSTSTPSDSAIAWETRTSADKTTWSGWSAVTSGTIGSAVQRYIQIRATLSASTGQSATPIVYSWSLSYEGDVTAPTNPSTFTGLSQSVSGDSLTSGTSYGYNHPVISWTGASDAATAVAGYYVYFGTDNTADPAIDGALQTGTTYTVTAPLSTGTYYLRLKTKDTAGNIASAVTGFTYGYSGVSPPQSQTATSTSDFSTGTASDVDASSNEIKLSGKAGFWEQRRLSLIPAGVSYGTGFAYVSSSNRLYTFRGNNTTTFYSYDVATDVWATLAAAPAAVFQGGDLIEGPAGYLYGIPGRALSSFWRYDIAANTWSDAAAADSPVTFNYGTSFIYDGSRYIYALRGNIDDAFLRYDTQTDTWDTLTSADFGAPIDQPDNNVYVGGDMAYDESDLIYTIQGNTRIGFSAYSISSNTWSTLPSLPALAYDGAQIVYDSTTSALYYTSGWSTEFMYKYDIATQTWSSLPNAPSTFSAGAAIRNIGGVLYALRGAGTQTFWTYDIQKASWKIPNIGLFGNEYRGTEYQTIGTGGNIVKGPGTYVYLVRGNFDNIFVRYDTSTGEATQLAAAPAGFHTGSAFAYDSSLSKIYAIPSQYIRKLLVYDIATDSWTEETLDPPPFDVGAGTSMVYDGSRYLYWNRGANTNTFYRFDTQGSAGSKWVVRATAPGTLLTGAELIYDAGYIYTPRGGNTLSFYRYDVGANTWSDPAVADLPSGATVSTDGFSVLNGNYIYTCRGGNTTDCFQYSISGNSWVEVADAPANITTGGAGATNGSDKIIMLAGAGTNTFSNGVYTYVMQTANSSVQEDGSFTSATHDLTSVYKYANISLTYTSATNANITVFTRSSSDDSVYSSWTEATEQKVVDSTYEYKIGSPAARYLQVKFELESSDSIYTGTIADYTINWYQDIANPTNPSVISAYDSVSLGSSLTTNAWYNHASPYFDWPDAEATNGASDTAEGSGVSGYYVAMTTSALADPESVGTFVTVSNFTAPTLTTGSTYYLRIKTKDEANNLSSATWEPFIYKYDSVSPVNPTTIVANPSGYSATNSFDFSWSGATDASSLIAQYCYKTGAPGSIDTCITGSSISGITAYTTGANTFSVRTKDVAGNYSSDYATASYYYSSTAPGAPQNLEVEPESNEDNEFAFTWQPPATYSGSQLALRYYYSVNAVPTINNVNAVGLQVTYLSEGAYATQKGTNTFYVVAKDEAGNIDYNNYASVSFSANTSAPGIPQNIDIADVSVKETKSWKLAISWEPPADAGSGLSNYKVYRSTVAGAVCSSNFDAFEYISTTTGKSFVDTDLEQQTYNYCSKACTSTNDCSAPSDTVLFFPDGKWKVAPELTSDPTVIAKTRTAALTWGTSREANSFVKYGKSAGSLNLEVGSSDLVTNHEIDLTSLDPGTTYYYKVLWTDEDGNSGESDEANFTTEAAPVVSAVKIEKISLRDAYVNFKVKNATKIVVQYGKTTTYGASESLSTSKSESTYTVQLSELLDGSIYHLRIVAEDNEGNTYNGDDYTFETLPVPKITTLRVQQVEGMPTATLRLLWTSNTRLTSIVTYYPQGKPALSKEFINLTPKTTHQAIIKELSDETDYMIEVRGKDPVGNEAVFTTQNVKTAQDLRPPEVSNINVETTIVGVGEEARAQTIITWDTDEPSSSQIEYGEGTSGAYTSSTQLDPILAGNHSVTIPGLTPSKIYHFRITSGDKNKNMGRSQDVVVITPNATKDALNLVVEKLSKTFGFLKNAKLK